jgi:hypothetical protein
MLVGAQSLRTSFSGTLVLLLLLLQLRQQKCRYKTSLFAEANFQELTQTLRVTSLKI